jgi:hypothetical protein
MVGLPGAAEYYGRGISAACEAATCNYAIAQGEIVDGESVTGSLKYEAEQWFSALLAVIATSNFLQTYPDLLPSALRIIHSHSCYVRDAGVGGSLPSESTS